jgi:polyisoprenoid-binding protein YceI
MMPIRSALVLLLAALPFAAHAADSYTVDGLHTFAHFKINHMGFSTLHGRFDKTSGKITLDTQAKTGSMDISIDTNSISTGYAKRDADLEGPDFFNAAEFPAMTYKAGKFHFKGDKPVAVDGELTLLGVSKPVKLTIADFHCGMNPMHKKPECGADATAEIKRSDFGMKTYLPKNGGPGIGDEVKLEFDIEVFKD